MVQVMPLDQAIDACEKGPGAEIGVAARVLVRELARSEARVLRLAQALRLLRDTTSGAYISNVAQAALDACGISDPPEEDHP